MFFILLFTVVVVAIVLFWYFHQNGNPQVARSLPLLAGAAITLIGFFGMPWVEVGGALEWLRTILDQGLVSSLADWAGFTGSLQELRDTLEIVTRISGFTLSFLPTVSNNLQMMIFLPLAAAILGIITSFLSMAKQRLSILAIIEIVVAVVAMGALLFSMEQISALGLNPGLMSMLSSILGDTLALELGSGYWATLAGLLVMAGGALLLLQESPVQSRERTEIERTAPRRRIAAPPPKRGALPKRGAPVKREAPPKR